MDFIERHVEALCRAAVRSPEQGAVGRVPRSWALSVGLPDLAPKLPSTPLTRAEVRSIARPGSGRSEDECFVACMAWGGQDTRHGRLALDERHRDALRGIIARVRSGALERKEAFAEFRGLREQGWRGARPPFFTKLIYFCWAGDELSGEVGRGFILDQWTARSLNLLTGGDLVPLRIGKYVADDVTPANYEAFCEALLFLAEVLERRLNRRLSGSFIEELLFSKGGAEKGEWRKYLLHAEREKHWVWSMSDVEFLPDEPTPGAAN